MSRCRRLAVLVYLATGVVVSTAACGGVVRTGAGSGDQGSGGWFTEGAGGSTPIGAGGWRSKPPVLGGSTGFGSGGFTSGGGDYPGAAGAVVSVGGAIGAGDGGAPSVYTCGTASPRDPGGSASLDDGCCKSSAGYLGVCSADPVAGGLIGRDVCGGGLRCVPNLLGGVGGHQPDEYVQCKASLGGAVALEGRCVPSCFTVGDPHARLFQQDDCARPDLLCAPCYDPITGTATGACSMKPGDQPFMPPPAPFRQCGQVDGGPSSGTCMPYSLAPEAFFSSTSQACSVGDYCVPTVKARDPSACFPRCTTSAAFMGLGAQFGPGTCVPTFVVQSRIGSVGLSILTRGGCPGSDDLCAPCLDPLQNGGPTHLCD